MRSSICSVVEDDSLAVAVILACVTKGAGQEGGPDVDGDVVTPLPPLFVLTILPPSPSPTCTVDFCWGV